MQDRDLQPVLSVEGLSVRFGRGAVPAVSNVTFDVGRERVGIVGESGSGKSTTGRAIMRLLPPAAVVSAERLISPAVRCCRRPNVRWARCAARISR